MQEGQPPPQERGNKPEKKESLTVEELTQEARNFKTEFHKWKEWRAIGGSDPDARDALDLMVMERLLDSFIAMLEESKSAPVEIELMLDTVSRRYRDEIELRHMGLRMPNENDPDR